jgi:hypothetical protein
MRKSNDDATSGRLPVSTPYFGAETYSVLQRNSIKLSGPIIDNLITEKGKQNKGSIQNERYRSVVVRKK